MRIRGKTGEGLHNSCYRLICSWQRGKERLIAKDIITDWVPGFAQPFLNTVQASPMGMRLLRGTFWSLAGAMLAKCLTLVSALAVARLLGRSGYGQLGIIQSTAGMFDVFAGFGLSITALRYVADCRVRDPGRAGRILALSNVAAMVTGLAAGAAMFLLSPWLAERTLKAPELTPMLQWTSLLLLMGALNGAQAGALAGFEAFRKIALLGLASGLCSLPLMVGGVLLAGLSGAVGAMLAMGAINLGLNHYVLRKEMRRAGIRYQYGECRREWPVLFRFSLPAVLSGLSVTPVIWACQTFLVRASGGFSELGLFNAAVAFQGGVLFIAKALERPLLSLISSDQGQRSQRLGSINMLSSWILGLLPALPLMLFPEILQFFYGEQYRGQDFLQCASLVVFYTCIVLYKQGLVRVLVSRELLWWGLVSNLIWAGITLAVIARLASWGALGLALTYAVAYAGNTLVMVPFYRRRRLVPSNTLLSMPAIMIWLVTMIPLLAVIGDVNPIRRAAILPILVLFTVFLFLRILDPRKATAWSLLPARWGRLSGPSKTGRQ